MTNLTKAHRELFRRTPDERFPTLQALATHCRERKEKSEDRWLPPRALSAVAEMDELILSTGDGGPVRMTDWSFTQLCSLAKVSKDTVNRLSAETAARVFGETIPRTAKPVQLFTEEGKLRSLHGPGYTRLHNAEVVSMLQEFAVDFQPPPVGVNGGTGLYAGEQDMFCFLVDPTGWCEIGGESFAPGFFVWNSEVGKRSIGVSTFWFQAVCQNHIVWDATEVVEFTRKHTGKVGEALSDIRRIVLALVEKREERRDGFVAVVKKAMETKLGHDAEEAVKTLQANGITRTLAKRAIEASGIQGRLTLFSVVDALTRFAGELQNAGERLDADERAGRLLGLADERRRSQLELVA